MADPLSSQSARLVHGVVMPSWSEQAVLVLSSPSGERTIVVEGSLDRVTRELAIRRPRWAGLSISLPDRHIEPLSYGPDVLADLVMAWTIDRDRQRPPNREHDIG
jgi:hypothetical protein